MTLTAEQGFTLDFRANILRGLAQRWDGMIFTHDMWLSQRDFTQAEKNASIDRLIYQLTLGAAEYAAPDMPMADIRFGMEDLRDAVNALARFEVGDGWDGDDDPEMAYYTDQMVLAMLNTDIDNALWPLLNGMGPGNVCFWCSRHKAEVTRWNVREAGSSRCMDCQEKGR